jgi:hypothetical protein
MVGGSGPARGTRQPEVPARPGPRLPPRRYPCGPAPPGAARRRCPGPPPRTAHAGPPTATHPRLRPAGPDGHRAASGVPASAMTGLGLRYVGRVELKATVRPGYGGRRIGSATDFVGWIVEQPAAQLAEPFTCVVGTDGALRPAPRRSEHVACAGGDMVLCTGEIGFTREADRWTVSEVGNQSTGYCPDAGSWVEVARTPDAVELRRPSGPASPTRLYSVGAPTAYPPKPDLHPPAPLPGKASHRHAAQALPPCLMSSRRRVGHPRCTRRRQPIADPAVRTGLLVPRRGPGARGSRHGGRRPSRSGMSRSRGGRGPAG